MASALLSDIQEKVRRLTRSPSVAQLSIVDLNNYINTFVTFDMPEHLRLFTLRQTFTFYTEPFKDVYTTDYVNLLLPLFDFENKVITIHDPVFVAGYRVLFQQSRESFFNIYPLTNTVEDTGFIGDSVTTAFAGTLSAKPVLEKNVTFVSRDDGGNALILSDLDTSGLLSIQSASGTGSTGTIDYETGEYTLNWTVAPGDGEPITSETIPYQAARPQAVLYYGNEFTLRPVPDKSYPVTMDAYLQPTDILAGQSSELEQWWQYIAYGAAKKVFEDRMDLDSVALIMQEFKQQERLVLRRTIVQSTNERTATIYTESSEFGLGNGSGTGNY